MSRFLHLKSLKLRNFKGVAELDLAFDASLTLLAGVNGVGKTSVMQALMAAVTEAWRLNPPHDYPRFRFPKGVLRAGTTSTEIVLELGAPDWSPLELRFETRADRLRLVKAQSSGLPLFSEKLQSPLPLGRVLRTESRRRPVFLRSQCLGLVDREPGQLAKHDGVLAKRVQGLVLRERGRRGPGNPGPQGSGACGSGTRSCPGLVEPTGRIYGRSIAKAT